MAAPPVDTRDTVAFELPDVPKEFGQDGKKFYRCYDSLADELDKDMVEGLKEQLEGILIFAGLFAGVNTAFLALTLPLMSPSPADDTNALLRENNAILLQLALGRNDSLPSPTPLPSQNFSPSGQVLTVNILFSVSLALALISSFLAVLGRQWLYEYRRGSGGAADSRRWMQLRRFLGAERWRLQPALDDFLPSILQFGLIIFCISLTIYLNLLDNTLSKVVAAFMVAGLAILIFTAIFAIWDPFCPFQTPLSRAISWAIRKLGALIVELTVKVCVVAIGALSLLLSAALIVLFVVPVAVVFAPVTLLLIWVFRNLDVWNELRRYRRRQDDHPSPSLSAVLRFFTTPVSRNPALRWKTRQRENIEPLQVAAAKRAVSCSDDGAILIHSISNLLAIREPYLGQLADDHDFCETLAYMCTNSYDQALQLLGRDQTSLAVAVTWRYRAAAAHIMLSSTSLDPWSNSAQIFGRYFEIDEEPGLSIPLELARTAPPVFMDGCLGYIAYRAANDERCLPVLDRMMQADLDGLLSPSWRRISMIVASISVRFRLSDWSSARLCAAYAGQPQAVLKNLDVILNESRDPSRNDCHALRYKLGRIFKVMGPAAINGNGHPRIEVELVAMLLRQSEVLFRVKNSPNGYPEVGRALRKDLVGGLLSALRSWDDSQNDNEDGLRGTLDELSHLLSNVVDGDIKPTLSSNEDDLELTSLVLPVLQCLDETLREAKTRSIYAELQMNILLSQFKQFESTVSELSRHTKRGNRDPDLQWCQW